MSVLENTEYAKIVTSIKNYRLNIGLFFEFLSRSKRQGLRKAADELTISYMNHCKVSRFFLDAAPSFCEAVLIFFLDLNAALH